MEPEWWTDLRDTLEAAGRPDLVKTIGEEMQRAVRTEREIVAGAFAGWIRSAADETLRFLRGERGPLDLRAVRPVAADSASNKSGEG